MSEQLNRVLSLVLKLTPQERRQVMVAIRARDGATVSAAETHQHAHDWLLPGIESELKRQGLLIGPLSVEKLNRWGSNYARESKSIREQLVTRYKKNPNQAELLAFGRICAKALISYVRENREASLGPRAVLAAVPDIAAALEASFPGYLQMGMLHMLIRS